MMPHNINSSLGTLNEILSLMMKKSKSEINNNSKHLWLLPETSLFSNNPIIDTVTAKEYGQMLGGFMVASSWMLTRREIFLNSNWCVKD